MRHNPNECANCGADRRPGSTLCKDCIIARGGRRNVHIIEGKYFMEIFYNGKNCAEIDLAGWTPREVARVMDIEVYLFGRTVKISIAGIGNSEGSNKESALPPASDKGKIS